MVIEFDTQSIVSESPCILTGVITSVVEIASCVFVDANGLSWLVEQDEYIRNVRFN